MLETVVQASAIFAVTNIDDIVLFALFFGRATGNRSAERNVIVGQYLGFGAIVSISVLAAIGLGLLPEDLHAYLGLIPLALGVRAAVRAGRTRADRVDDVEPTPALGVWAIAGVTLANGGDNIGVYVPVFTSLGGAQVATYVVVFLTLVAVWCLAGRYFAARPLVAKALTRWGHVLLPVVLITIGVIILVEGGAFGL